MSLRPIQGDTEQPGLRRKALVLVFALVLVALLINALFGDGGVLQLVEQRGRAASLGRDLDVLRAENDRLAREIAVLRTDPRTVEQLAREELGLASPGETVFLIRDESTLADR
jgi:cell division protein FtsB